MRFAKNAFAFLFVVAMSCSEDASLGTQPVGQGGSTSRYTIQNNYLYVVDDVSLRVYDIGGGLFTQVSVQEVGFGIETIFSRPDFLYLGAADGMYIYSLSSPANPSFVFVYSHIRSCDPVVVQGNRAYVTLNNANGDCGRGVNELHIIDITNRQNPSQVAVYSMTSPRGLGVDGTYLFVSEGQYGLKVLDITNERSVKVLESLTDIHAFDVIARANRLTVTGQDGIFQYSYPSDGDKVLKLLSKIAVSRQ